jgi:hypothetical protein
MAFVLLMCDQMLQSLYMIMTYLVYLSIHIGVMNRVGYECVGQKQKPRRAQSLHVARLMYETVLTRPNRNPTQFSNPLQERRILCLMNKQMSTAHCVCPEPNLKKP